MTLVRMGGAIRVAMVAVTVPAMVVAIWWPSVLGVLFILTSFLMALLPSVLVSLFRPLPAGIAFGSMLLASLLVVPSFVLGWADEDTAPVLVLAVSVTVVLAGLARSRSTMVSRD